MKKNEKSEFSFKSLPSGHHDKHFQTFFRSPGKPGFSLARFQPRPGRLRRIGKASSLQLVFSRVLNQQESEIVKGLLNADPKLWETYGNLHNLIRGPASTSMKILSRNSASSKDSIK